jgi:hypothetical protein
MNRKMFVIPSSKERISHCPDCKNKIVDEFPDIKHVCCDGCPRIFNRIKEVRE